MAEKMMVKDLLKVSRRAVQGLIPETVRAVAVGWNAERAHLILRYYCDSEVSELETEACSVALAEIDAAYWQGIKTCSDECVYVESEQEVLDPLEGFVYVRDN